VNEITRAGEPTGGTRTYHPPIPGSESDAKVPVDVAGAIPETSVVVVNELVVP